jgi:hypothetical protein
MKQNHNNYMSSEREYLCCVVQKTDMLNAYDAIDFYEANRYYPGLTGSVILCENQILVVLEGSKETIIKKFMEMTNSFKTFIQIVRSEPLINNKRTFNSWDLGINMTCEESKILITGINQEEVSSLNKIMQDKTEGNDLTEFIKSFLSDKFLSHNDF